MNSAFYYVVPCVFARSLTKPQEKLIKIGGKMVRHARYVTLQLAEVAIPRRLYRAAAPEVVFYTIYIFQ